MRDEADLLVFPAQRPRLDALFFYALAFIACGLLVYRGRVTFEGWIIPPTYGWIGLVLFGTVLLRGILLALRRRPSLRVTAAGVTVRQTFGLSLGPIAWDEVYAFCESPVGDSDERRLSIQLKDPAATYQRLGQNWFGLLRWLATLGDPLRLGEDELDRPVGELVEYLEARRRAAVEARTTGGRDDDDDHG